jgi:hypothetical protein
MQVREFAKCLNFLELFALVITQGMAIKGPLIEHEKKAISIDSSEDSPHFFELNERIKQLARDMRKMICHLSIFNPMYLFRKNYHHIDFCLSIHQHSAQH